MQARGGAVSSVELTAPPFPASRLAIKQKGRSDCSDRPVVLSGDDLLSHTNAVPSALAGLTSLFGMGRGDPRRNSHHLKVSRPWRDILLTYWNVDIACAVSISEFCEKVV